MTSKSVIPHHPEHYLVLTELFLPTKGGTAVWFDAVYRHLGGKATHILTASVPRDAAHDRDHPNTVHRLRLAHHPWLRPASLPLYLRFFASGLMLAVRNRFTAIHAGRVLPEGLCGLAIARLTGHPLVIYAHGEEITDWKHHPRRLRGMQRAYRGADCVIANSDFTRQELIAIGVSPDRITILNPGVDLNRFHPGYETEDLRRQIGLAPGQRLILSVGRLTRRKGFDQVIAALPGLLASGIDAHHAIIGIGEDEAYLREQARLAGVEARVHLLGHVDAADLPRWYCAADVFAMPNRAVGNDTEGFGMVFIEAAACGTPSVAGLAGGTGNAVLDGETGLRVEGADATAVFDALRTMLGNTGLAGRLADNALARAHSDFSWERVADITASLGRRS